MGRIRTWWRQVKVEAALPDQKPTSATRVRKDIQSMQFGLLCVMALGGHKVAPEMLKDEEIKVQSDKTITLITNVLMMLRAAEDVITRHRLLEEYRNQTGVLQKDVEAAMKAEIEGVSAAVKDVLAREAKKEMDAREGKNGSGNGEAVPASRGSGEGLGQEDLRAGEPKSG
jgi:hypothetical protein